MDGQSKTKRESGRVMDGEVVETGAKGAQRRYSERYKQAEKHKRGLKIVM